MSFLKGLSRQDAGPTSAEMRNVLSAMQRERAGLEGLVQRAESAANELRAAQSGDAVTMAASLGDALQLRFFLGLLAGLALVVASVGVYGVVGWSVARRRGEYGIRMALGADAGRVVGGVLAREMMPVLAGALAGVLAALLSSRAIAGLVWEVSPSDPASLAAGALALLGVGLVAVLLPALRVARLDPSTVLRRE